MNAKYLFQDHQALVRGRDELINILAKDFEIPGQFLLFVSFLKVPCLKILISSIELFQTTLIEITEPNRT